MKRTSWSVAVLLLWAGTSGCASIVKQTIVSSVNTGIGATLAQNPQTQLYEVKIGYIRSQFYSVPTSKTICEKDDIGCKPSNDADKAPQLVSGIRVHSGAEQLFLGVDVSESFAVGNIAVMSPAAVAMYVADADSDEKAKAAKDAAVAMANKSTASIASPGSADLEALYKSIVDAHGDVNKTPQVEQAVKEHGYADWDKFVDRTPPPDVPTLKAIKAQIDAPPVAPQDRKSVV